MALTTVRRARLEKLAAYLESLPENYRRFNMSSYIIPNNGSKAVLNYARKNGGVAECGTAACAVGHGPAAGILMPPRFTESGFPDWPGYSELFTGADSDLFDWLFSGVWQRIDNSHHGAAARIRYVLDTGGAPDDFCRPARHWREMYAPYRIDAKAKADA